MLLREDYEDASSAKVTWLNEPPGLTSLLEVGKGKGFARLTETPHFAEQRPRPTVPCDMWVYTGWIVASPKFAQIVRDRVGGAIATIPVDWVFADGQKLQGYVFLDVLPMIHAYDYQRSAAVVRIGEKAHTYSASATRAHCVATCREICSSFATPFVSGTSSCRASWHARCWLQTCAASTSRIQRDRGPPIPDVMERKMRMLLRGTLVTIAALTACNRQQAEGGRDGGPKPASAAEIGFAQCVRDEMQKPWNVVDALLQPDGFVVRVAAAAADLQLPHRDNASREQQFVDVSIGSFTSYHVFDPKVFAGLVNSGTMRATPLARGVAASNLTPLDVYEFGDANVLLLINARQGQFCIDRAPPPHWPNPYTRCQLVVEPYSASFRVSSEALGSLPQLFTQVRQLIDHAAACSRGRGG